MAGSSASVSLTVPTRMYLGVADAFAFHGLPGFYDDNSGSFLVRMGFFDRGGSGR